jgi:hypothetical protein
VTAQRGITVEELTGTLSMIVKAGFSEIERRRDNRPIVRLAL